MLVHHLHRLSVTDKADIAVCYDDRNKPPLLFQRFGSVIRITTPAEVPRIDVFIVFLRRLLLALSMKDDFPGVVYSYRICRNMTDEVCLSEETKVEKGS